MPRPVRAAATAAALAACVVTAGAAGMGCGGGGGGGGSGGAGGGAAAGVGPTPAATANVYVAQVGRALAGFRRDYAAVQKLLSTPTSTPGQERRALDRLRLGVDRLVAGLRAVQPPDAVAARHRALIAAVLRYDPAIARRRAAADASSRAVLAANTRFTTDIGAINAAISATIARINDDLAH